MGTDGDIDRPGWAALPDRAQVAGLASVGAGAIHLVAAGSHAEDPSVARTFVLLGAVQVVAGLVLALSGRRLAAVAVAAVSAVAVGGWVLTRTSGISWIDGLDVSESPQFADTVCAVLGALGLTLAAVVIARGGRPAPRVGLVVPGALIALFSVAAMLNTTTHVHAHGTDGEAAAHEHATVDAGDADHAHDGGAAGGAAATDGTHDHADAPAGEPAGHDHAAVDPTAWPRAWDPTAPIDLSGVPGVTAEQQERAEALVASTLTALPRFADVATVRTLGFRSIGDAATGFEHFINPAYIGDDSFLDPSRPESLVYEVDGTTKTLVSAMFIASDVALDDPQLVDYGGPLMQWHVHDDLCWKLGADGKPVVAGTTDEDGACAPGTINAGGRNPMVHVWIGANECGPFAALEGHGAGQTSGDGARTDQCAHDHGGGEPVPFDPTAPVDLSGTPGVTSEQQAFAEDLVDRTLTDLPQWADPKDAEAAGFHSIGDAATGHEHYIQWDWIDDDVTLDPNHPESLVYERRPDGTKQLVSAMYMLPTSVALEDVPDWGGPLMQWHVHDNLCYTDDPEAPKVRGLTRSDGTCPAPLVKHDESPMIHVWITPHECGPFAALEGVGAGAIPEGEERLCDHAHGGG
jgi:hypothetical protein